MKKNIKIIVFGIISIALAAVIAACILGQRVQVVIDPGHGGNDVGAEYNGRYEKDDNLKISLLVAEKLKHMGIDAVLTRKNDKYISLEKRCEIANKKQAKVFASLHRNSAENAKGVEIWVGSDSAREDTDLAETILSELDKAGISQNRGVKSGYAQSEGKDYYVNSHTNMTSCLVELGFITSETDNQLLDEKSDEYAQAIAEAIAQIVL